MALSWNEIKDSAIAKITCSLNFKIQKMKSKLE